MNNKLCIYLILPILTLILINCDKNTNVNIPAENYLGGDANITLGQVGNTATTTVKIGDNYYNTNEDIELTENVDGVVNIKYKADYSQIPELATFNDMIPDEYKDNAGKVDIDFKFKITSDGLQDYMNLDGNAHTLVNYNSVVGEAYSIRQSDGVVLSRKVSAKSTEDDFAWGWYDIKTITVEQNAPIPGVNKYIVKANHRFGIVWFEVVMEDGSSVGTYIYPTNY